MKQKYSCTLTLLTKPEYFKGTLLKVLDKLTYTPQIVYCFYNEFNRPPGIEVPFNRQFLLENLSTQEMKGITSMSFYDKYYKPDQVTPFVRIRFNIERQIEKSFVNIEWIAFENLDFLINGDQVIHQYLSADNSLLYCYFSNQIDTFDQSNKPESWFRKYYGKSVIEQGIEFQAAPIMYFGKAINPIIPFTQLVKAGGRVILVGDFAKFELGNLYDDPLNYRNAQKEFWKKMKLNNLIKTFSSQNKPEAIQEYERRYELFKRIK